MKTWTKAAVTALFLATVAGATPGYAGEPSQAWLYELTENMTITAFRRGPARVATSQLMGYAVVGSPLCPAALVAAANPNATFCTLNATGSDNISLKNGKGHFGGKFTVVVQDVNPFDGPEVVVGTGEFSGRMDFSPAILHSIPLGYVQGTMAFTGGRKIPFTGTFRLPTAPIADPSLAAYCQVSTDVPAWCLQPLYLLDDYSWEKVRDDEKALGYPTVRFEITF